MCGIVGFVGQWNTKDILLSGLSRLEYRGYDSAGIALYSHPFTVVKSVGKLEELKKRLLLPKNVIFPALWESVTHVGQLMVKLTKKILIHTYL